MTNDQLKSMTRKSEELNDTESNINSVQNILSNNNDNNNNPESLLNMINTGSESTIRVSGRKRNMSHASDSSHINQKQKVSDSDAFGVEESNIQPLSVETNKLIEDLKSESYSIIDDIGSKQEIMTAAIEPIPGQRYSGIWLRVREVLETRFGSKSIIYDDTFDTMIETDPITGDVFLQNVLRNPEAQDLPRCIPKSEIDFLIFQSIEGGEDSGNESSNSSLSPDNVNANSVDIMRSDYPELETQYPEQPGDHNLAVESTDDSRSGIDPENEDDYPSETSEAYSSSQGSLNEFDSLPEMVELSTDLPLNRIGYSDEARADCFVHNNYLVEMKGIDNLNFRTVYEDIIEYLNLVDNLQVIKLELLNYQDHIEGGYFSAITHEVFHALLYIAQFN